MLVPVCVAFAKLTSMDVDLGGLTSEGFNSGILVPEGVHSDLLSSGGVDSDCSKRTAFEGASCLSLTSPGLRGWIPHFLKY